MTITSQVRVYGLFVIVLVILTFVFALNIAPSVHDQGDDTPNYAYVAQIMVDGGLPYRDAAESKPPLTFIFNALAFTLWGVSSWSLWGLIVTMILITSLCFALVLRDAITRRWLALAGAGTLALLLTRPIWADTNTPELYALPFQFMCLWASYRLLRQPHWPWALIAGLAGGTAMLGKQTSGGLLVTLVPTLILGLRSLPLWQRGRLVIVVGLGALVPLAGTVLILAGYGILDEAYDGVIAFNQHHVNEQSNLWRIVTSFIRQRYVFWTIYVPASLWAAWALLRLKQQDPRQRTLILWLAFTVPLELVLVNMTSTAYAHYFLTPLPALLTLAMIGIEASLKHSSAQRLPRWLRTGSVALTLIVVLLPNLTYSITMFAQDGEHLFTRDTLDDPVQDYVLAHTDPDDLVLVWGYRVQINFYTGRRSPSPYFNSHHVTLPGHSGPERIAEFVDDLRTHQPALIVDVSMVKHNKVPPLDAARMQQFWDQGGWTNTPDIGLVRDFVETFCEACWQDEITWRNESGLVVAYHCTY